MNASFPRTRSNSTIWKKLEKQDSLKLLDVLSKRNKNRERHDTVYQEQMIKPRELKLSLPSERKKKHN